MSRRFSSNARHRVVSKGVPHGSRRDHIRATGKREKLWLVRFSRSRRWEVYAFRPEYSHGSPARRHLPSDWKRRILNSTAWNSPVAETAASAFVSRHSAHLA